MFLGGNMHYIELTQSDLNKEIIDLYQYTFNQAPWFDHWDDITTTKRLTQLFTTMDFYGLALYSNKELIGFILGYDEVYYDKTMFVIKEFCISPDKQRGGYGKKLLKQLEQNVMNKGCQSMMLMTLKADQTLNFYLKNDYQVIDSLVMMSKPL